MSEAFPDDGLDAKEGAEMAADYIDGLREQSRDLTDKLDLMTDEFQRIAACPGATSEILDICARAAANIRQNVPVITQRDNAVREMERLRQIISKAHAMLLHSAHSPTPSVLTIRAALEVLR